MELDSLSRLLNASGLMAKKQDGKIILYNRGFKYLSKGVLVEDLKAAETLVAQYVRFIQTSGFKPLVDFAAENPYRKVPFAEVDNKVDPQSPYFVRAASLSVLDCHNLLMVARRLTKRAEDSYSSRVASTQLTDKQFHRHRKLKAVVASLLRK